MSIRKIFLAVLFSASVIACSEEKDEVIPIQDDGPFLVMGTETSDGELTPSTESFAVNIPAWSARINNRRAAANAVKAVNRENLNIQAQNQVINCGIGFTSTGCNDLRTLTYYEAAQSLTGLTRRAINAIMSVPGASAVLTDPRHRSFGVGIQPGNDPFGPSSNFNIVKIVFR